MSKVYSLLLDIEEADDNSRQRWGREIQEEIEVGKWQATNEYILSTSANVAIHESFYKLRHQWYLTPLSLK